MKQKIIALAITVFVAATTQAATTSTPIQASEMTKAPLAFICSFYKVVKAIVGPIAVLLFVATGATYIASADNKSTRAEAKERLKHILIGLTIVIVADAIVSIILAPPEGWCP